MGTLCLLFNLWVPRRSLAEPGAWEMSVESMRVFEQIYRVKTNRG